jgi:hypothetical protein
MPPACRPKRGGKPAPEDRLGMVNPVVAGTASSHRVRILGVGQLIRLSDVALARAVVTLDQGMGECRCRRASSSRFDSSSSWPASRSRNACRSATSMRIASWKCSTLAIDDRRLLSYYAVGVVGLGGIGVGVVEGVERAIRRDVDAKAHAGRQVADGQFHPVARRVPEEKNFLRPAPPLG